MLTINEEVKSREDLIDVMWKAFSYFPEGVWKEVNYVGNVSVKCDLTIESKEETHEAFIFSHLARRIREMRSIIKTDELLVGVTHNPVIVTYHRFDTNKFKRIVNIVHDYVSNDIGIISFFKAEDESAVKIAAHGLGHNQGLTHHAQPIDIMYLGLLNGNRIKINGFCIECLQKLKKAK